MSTNSFFAFVVVAITALRLARLSFIWYLLVRLVEYFGIGISCTKSTALKFHSRIHRADSWTIDDFLWAKEQHIFSLRVIFFSSGKLWRDLCRCLFFFSASYVKEIHSYVLVYLIANVMATTEKLWRAHKLESAIESNVICVLRKCDCVYDKRSE